MPRRSPAHIVNTRVHPPVSRLSPVRRRCPSLAVSPLRSRSHAPSNALVPTQSNPPPPPSHSHLHSPTEAGHSSLPGRANRRLELCCVHRPHAAVLALVRQPRLTDWSTTGHAWPSPPFPANTAPRRLLIYCDAPADACLSAHAPSHH
ncbi:hypothetical protein BDV93DRAFT_555655 [Ceratobasidium sp. AG-I]|nr:hypothetical protein BDV93DRAFT_555655 [Ceratobasidium sp. AG-I]